MVYLFYLHPFIFIIFLNLYPYFIFVYIRTKASYDPVTGPLLSVFYAVVTPILNPIIYSLQNTNVKAALKRTIQKIRLTEI